MKKLFILIAGVSVVATSCNESKLSNTETDNTETTSQIETTNETKFPNTITVKGLAQNPEGIEYNKNDKTFLLSSLNAAPISKVSLDGTFKAFTKEEMLRILEIAMRDTQINLEDEAKEYLISSSSGDARAMLTLLNFSYKVNDNISKAVLKELRENVIGDGVSSSDTHYDLASAMIKSIRGSDVDAALYYLARLIHGGESVDFITRRLVIFASEDIGNANPNALNLAVSTMTACNKIGHPESRIILGQCIIYLASSPKSNSAYNAINKALQGIKDGISLDIPKHLDSQHIGYLYPHDFGGYVEQKYLEENLDLYKSKSMAFEKTLDEWLKKIKQKD